MEEESLGTGRSPPNSDDVDAEVPEPTKDENGKDVYLCDSCGSLFAYSYSLLAHKRHKCHAGKGEFKCEMCNKRFNFPSQLQRHMPTHTGEKPFQCHHCPKAFNESSNLKQHMLIHTDQKPFCCDFLDCDKRFRSASNLKVHVRTHTKERPYICEFSGCGKRFVSAGDLKRHFRIHTKERPYVCQYCGKSFIQGPYLNIHIRSHTKEKPYNCSHCGKAFSRTSTLKIHLRLHSGDKATDKNVKAKPLKSTTSCDKTPVQFSGTQVQNSATHAKSEPFDMEHGSALSGDPVLEYRASHNMMQHQHSSADNYSYMQSLMFDYGERDVPCGTLPNGQTVPLTGRNASILRPRAKRAEGATTPLSPDINQGDKMSGIISAHMMPPLAGPEFYHPPPRLSPSLLPFPPNTGMLSDMVPPPSMSDKIPPLVPVPLPPPSYPFLGPLPQISEPSYLHTSQTRRDFRLPDHEMYTSLRTPQMSPPTSEHGMGGGFKPYSGLNHSVDDLKTRHNGVALANDQIMDTNAIV